MDTTQRGVELRMPHRRFRWDTGLFFVFVLSLVSAASLFPLKAYLAMSSSPAASDAYYAYLPYRDLAFVPGVLCLGSVTIWVMMMHGLNRSTVRIAHGRVEGRIFDARTNHVAIDVAALDAIDVKKGSDGRIVSLLLHHAGGTVALTGFPDLEGGLHAILRERPEGIVVREKVPTPVGLKALWVAAGLACVFMVAVPVYLRDYVLSVGAPIGTLFIPSWWAMLILLRMKLAGRQMGGHESKMKWEFSAIFIFAAMSLLLTITLT